MRPFAYERAADAAAAVALLAAHPRAKPLAGGTNLVDLMRLGVEDPDTLVDINRIDFGGIDDLEAGGIRVGAGVRNSDLAGSLSVRVKFPVLAEAILAGASGQVRNMASVGGNLLQRTRCLYFTDTTKPCNKRLPGSGCPAIAGSSRELAILGASPSCIATYPGDMAVALSALSASVNFLTLDGEREMAVDDFYRLPGDRPELDTNLPAGAVITGITVPSLAAGVRSTYRKARDRRSFAFGLVTLAAALHIEGGIIVDVRLAFGGVAHKPWRATRAEALLRGSAAEIERFEAAIDAELAQATPTEENAFKVALLRRLVVGTLVDLSLEAAP
ncbi:MAG: xanthine dehydrogenase family protein subunit M [Actinobacteria bacterium]|nr:xanthine dehydrogenase family protein subunit M [Actinomycetota bacterium]